VIEDARNAPMTDRIKAAFLFLQNSQRDRALSFLRKVPPGHIPIKLARSLVDDIPEGASPQHVQSVIVTASSNGAGDWALIKCPREYPQLRKLALEVVAAHGPDLALQAAVCDVCMQCIASPDLRMVCAALRCLIGTGGVGRLAAPDVVKLISSDDYHVRLCGVIAGTKMAIDGRLLAEEVVDLIIPMADEPWVQACVVAMARGEVLGRVIVTRIIDQRPFDVVTTLKVFLAAARNKGIRPLVREALERIDISAMEDEWGAEIGRLREVVAA
jgi:hypothetical protein